MAGSERWEGQRDGRVRVAAGGKYLLALSQDGGQRAGFRLEVSSLAQICFENPLLPSCARDLAIAPISDLST